MKKHFLVFLSLLLSLMFALTLSAAAQQYIDPILLDKPDPNVYQCGEDLFLEKLGEATIGRVLGGNMAKEQFFFFRAELLYLREAPWNGIAKESFVLKQITSDGKEVLYPLNYMMTVKFGMQNTWKTISNQMTFATLMDLMLVFDVPYNVKAQSLSMIFRPSERDGEPVCEVEVPLKVSY